MRKLTDQCGKIKKGRSWLIAMSALCLLNFAVNAQKTKIQVSNNAYLSKGLTITNVLADDDKFELKVVVFNNTPNVIKAPLKVYAVPYGYLDASFDPWLVTLGNKSAAEIMKAAEKLYAGKTAQQIMDEIPLKHRIKPSFSNKNFQFDLMWWKSYQVLEFRPNSSREITFNVPRYSPGDKYPTKIFFPGYKFPLGFEGYICTPIVFTTFDKSSFYAVVDDNEFVPERQNSSLFLDRWAEYDKKKK